MLNPEKAVFLGEHKIDSKKHFKEKFVYNNKSKEIFFSKNFDLKLEEDFFFDYCFRNLERGVEFKGVLREMEFVMVQRMVNYSIPFMMGWHILNSNKIAEEDLINSPDS